MLKKPPPFSLSCSSYCGEAFSKERIIGYPATSVASKWKKLRHKKAAVLNYLALFQLAADWGVEISRWTLNTAEFNALISWPLQSMQLCFLWWGKDEGVEKNWQCCSMQMRPLTQYLPNGYMFFFFQLHTAVRGNGGRNGGVYGEAETFLSGLGLCTYRLVK